jgi:murein hydrolase activator
MSLLHNKQQLEETVQQLSKQVKQSVFRQQSSVPNLPFGELRGKLSWPAQGHIRDAFGTQVYQSQLRWDGTLIAAPLGEPIHAVAAGRVIFSKWMAGYGLLLIVNQGNGYMTLYGRAQTLTKSVGDYIKANEVIGTVGKSGGFTRPSLYFSIRHDGTAINPATFCK